MSACDCSCGYTVRGCTVQATVAFVGAAFEDALFLQDCAPSLFGDHPCTPNPYLCFTKVPESRALRVRYRITEYDPSDGVTVWLEDLKEYSRWYGDLQHHKITDGCIGPCPGYTYDPCVELRYEYTLDDDNNCTKYGPADTTNTRCGTLAPWGFGFECDIFTVEDGTYTRLISGDCDRAGGFYHMEEIWYEDIWTRQECEQAAVSLAQLFEPTPALPHTENFKRVKLSGKYPPSSVVSDACSRGYYVDDGTGETVAFGRWDIPDLLVAQPAADGFGVCPRVNKLHVHYERGGTGAAVGPEDYQVPPARLYVAADTYTGLKRAMGTTAAPFFCGDTADIPSPSIGYWAWIRMKNTLIAGNPLDLYRHQCCPDWLSYRRWPSGTWMVSPSALDVRCLEPLNNCSSAQVALGQLEHPKYTPIIQAWDDELCATRGLKSCDPEVEGVEVWQFPIPDVYCQRGIGPADCFTDPCAASAKACPGDTAEADGACPAAIACAPNMRPPLCPGAGNYTFDESC